MTNYENTKSPHAHASPTEGPEGTADNSTLLLHEFPWLGRQPFLESKGYMLRPRLRPGWTPSWISNGKDPALCEDNYPSPMRILVTDATRIADGKLVCIKKISTGNKESNTALLLRSKQRREDPRNHSVPILDVLEDPDDSAVSYMVMPFFHPMDDPPFESVDEIVDFVDQVLEGLAFMHEQGVAHRDCSPSNIMMDAAAMFPCGFHPALNGLLPDASGPVAPTMISRSKAGVRYYFVDYDISSRNAPGHPEEVTGTEGRDEEVPELAEDVAYNPFKVDVFSMGNLLKHEFHERFSNVDFLAPLLNEMMIEDPMHRPTAEEALRQWRSIRADVADTNAPLTRGQEASGE
ncbi:hypothetical protein FA95DRAFT_1496145 [Auriscalpium vulgare]|uniref:Uncharacterized protein n=1 Tax=Auriscalpium vulgare TaxID=40419 RepID=A0ACB8RMJ4_9AGAM|nr:hypothetical protein FA95DRAFT_1496145 [Auriscalpium vulgare]